MSRILVRLSSNGVIPIYSSPCTVHYGSNSAAHPVPQAMQASPARSSSFSTSNLPPSHCIKTPEQISLPSFSLALLLHHSQLRRTRLDLPVLRACAWLCEVLRAILRFHNLVPREVMRVRAIVADWASLPVEMQHARRVMNLLAAAIARFVVAYTDLAASRSTLDSRACDLARADVVSVVDVVDGLAPRGLLGGNWHGKSVLTWLLLAHRQGLTIALSLFLRIFW